MDKAILSLCQLENGYCYNSDSLFLYAFITRFLKKGTSLLDIGAGCGILGLLCARDFGVDLTLIDIDERNAKLCKKNADYNNLKATIFNVNIMDLLPKMPCDKTHDLQSKCDLLQNLIAQKFDFIIANPPFYDRFSPPPQNNHLFLAKKDENLPFDKLALFAKNALLPKGKFIFCYKSSALAGIFAILKALDFNVSALQFVHPKQYTKSKSKKNATLVMICADFSKQYLEVLPPIFNFVDLEHSTEAMAIFALCKTQSIKIKESEL